MAEPGTKENQLSNVLPEPRGARIELGIVSGTHKGYTIEKMTESPDKKRLYYRCLPIIIIGFVIFFQSVQGVYAANDMTPPGAFEFLSYLGLFWLVGDWFSRDSKEYKVKWAYDMGFFLYVAWPILIPWYLFKTRGLSSAFPITFGFVVLNAGAHFMGYIIVWGIAR
jgi:hypothetical protein